MGRVLVERTGVPEGQAFFCNSGTEAIEAAIKLARKAARTVRGRDAFEIIVADHGFHGRTMGALSATMVPRYHEDFGPLVPGFVEVPFNDLAAVERAITLKTAAVLMEPVRGEGGITPTSDAYLRGLRGLCDALDLIGRDEAPIRFDVGKQDRRPSIPSDERTSAHTEDSP